MGAAEREGKLKSLPGLSVRGSANWIRWIDKTCARERRTRAGLIEVALIAWARSQGLKDPPPRQSTTEEAEFA